MKWNPFLSKRGRIIAVLLLAMLTPIGYLASYPVANRLLLGRDARQPNWANFSAVRETRRPGTWRWLRTYWFRPAEWLIDNTPAHSPVMFLASMVDVEKRLADEHAWRRFVVEVNANQRRF